ncbi:MAG: TGS domain-containing protein, partial [Planctomycetota bacterium]
MPKTARLAGDDPVWCNPRPGIPMNETMQITLPDGSVREMPAGTTGLELAGSIGKGLLKAAVAIRVDGELQSLQR